MSDAPGRLTYHRSTSRGPSQRKEPPTMADDPTKGKSSDWPNGEPKSVRDAYDKQQSGKSGGK
ncbi:hypothetical protein Acsp03_27530 [Actinomadura sp. NBRC 104412]|nr:hypothetical protein Acsp03_27530 [Actinomadura sp. NBRC 104412]